MAASLDTAARAALDDAVRKRLLKIEAESQYADAYLRFLRDARAAGWSWRRIGDSLGITARAVETYWKRNRMRAGRLGDAPAA